MFIICIVDLLSGAVSFLIFIDDLAKVLENNGIIAKIFADEVKLYLEISTADDCDKLQKGLDIIAGWACEWQLISVDKCSTLTVGSCSVRYRYVVADSELPCKTHCKDLGITMSSNLSPSQHIGEITAYRRSNCILKCFAPRDNDLYVRAFVVYVRPILECNSIVWSPWLKQDIDQIEKVQRRFTKKD